MLESKIYGHLSTSAAVVAAVGTRIYPVRAPQDVTAPYIVYSRISGGQISGLSGYQTMENPRIQIDVFTTSYSTAKGIADSIHSLMETASGYKSILISDMDLFEEDFSFYRVSMDFSVFNRE